MKKNPWLTAVACLLLQLCLGAIYLWSALRPDLADALTPAYAETAGQFLPGVMLIFLSIGCLAGGFLPIDTRLTGLIGTIIFALGLALSGLAKSMGVLYVTYGLLSGLGIGLALSASLNRLPQTHPISAWLPVASLGISALIFVPVSHALIRANTDAQGTVSFRTVFLILAVIFAVAGIVGSLLLPREKQTANPMPTGARQPLFWQLFVVIFLLAGAWAVCLPRLADLSMARGLSQTVALGCVCLCGIAAALGHFASVSLTHTLGPFLPLYTLSGLTVISAIVLTFARGYGCCVAMAFLSFSFGGCLAPGFRLCRMLLGKAHGKGNTALLLLAPGLSCIVFQGIARMNLVAAFILSAVAAAAAVYLVLRLNYALDARKSTKA